MGRDAGLAKAAQLFRALGNESRLELMRIIDERPRTVGALAAATGMSQPLVSQHLRNLRNAGLVAAERSGKEVIYEVADRHITHVISDALAHVLEPELQCS